jgi:hypothetical protein
MPNFTDGAYLTQDHYRDASNLNARIQLHRKFSTNPYGWYDWVFDTLAQLPAGTFFIPKDPGLFQAVKQENLS